MWVSGCPVKQEITDNSVVIASGEGLVRGIEDRVAMFYVDTKGQRGDLHVQVDGQCVPDTFEFVWSSRFMKSVQPVIDISLELHVEENESRA